MNDNSFEMMRLPAKQKPQKNREQEGNTPFSLKDYAKSRLLHDALASIKARCKLSPEYLILVLDDHASKVLSAYCGMYDLMEFGSIYQMEQVIQERKRYPYSDVVYLVEPSPSSIAKILGDFPEVDKFSYDQYGHVHLCFLTTVPDEQLASLCRAKKLVEKVKTFYEINIDFTVWQDNIFKIAIKQNNLIKLINPDKKSKQLIEQLSHKLFSLCAVMNERPYIQYQADSLLCEEVALNVYKKLEYLYGYSQGGALDQGNNQIQAREPRGTLLILDRTIDMIAPLMHDYYYQSILFDYLKVPESCSLDDILPQEESKEQRQAASAQSKKLSDEDEIWQKYKYLHIAEAMVSLEEDIRQLYQDQQTMKSLAGKQQELTHHEMMRLLRQIPEFEKKLAQSIIHKDLTQQTINIMQNPSLSIMTLIEFEQSIISGMDDKGNVMADNVVAKQLTKLIKDLGRSEDKLRLLSIYLLCYCLPDADFKTLCSLVDTPEEKTFLKLVRDYNKEEVPKKPKRTYPILSASEFSDYKRKFSIELKEQYDILRTQPRIAKIARDALQKQLDPTQFSYAGDERPINSQRERNPAVSKWQKLDKDAEDERLIIAMIGGISHYELCSLANLDKVSNTHNLVVGSTQIITSMDFIDSLVPQRKKEKKSHRKRNDDSEEDKNNGDEDEEAEREMDKVRNKRQQIKQKKAQPAQKNIRNKNRGQDSDSDDQESSNNAKSRSVSANNRSNGEEINKMAKGKAKALGNKRNKEVIDLEDVQIEDKSYESDDSSRKNRKKVTNRTVQSAKGKQQPTNASDEEDSDVKSTNARRNARSKQKGRRPQIDEDQSDSDDKRSKPANNKNKRQLSRNNQQTDSDDEERQKPRSKRR